MIKKRVAVMMLMVLCAAGAAMAQTEWIQHQDNPVIGLGEPGEWDEGGRSAGSVILVGSTYHMWFSGGSGDPGLQVGHATSEDGVTWTMDPANPVMTFGAPGEWDELGEWLPQVISDGTQFHMWYSGIDADNYYRGGYATSPDGVVWTKHPDNPVMDVGPAGSWEDRGVRPGGVVFDGETFKMWYTGWGSSTSVQVGYAESPDGVHWTRRAEPVLAWEELPYPGAPGQSSCNPSVVFDGSIFHMFYVCADLAANYAFSSDGITWARHRDNPVIEVAGEIASAPIFFDGSTWHMWYTHRLSGHDQIAYATSDCCPGVAALEHLLFIPAAALASGAHGSFFQTDVDLSNAGSQPVEYQLVWLPRGGDNSDPMTSASFTLGAGMSVRYANVLSEVFGLQPDSVGALALVSSSPDLLSMSRIYNTPNGETAGTYGQAMPAIATDDFITSGERKRILFATENDAMRTNVGCQNLSGGALRIYLELFDAEGTSLETKSMTLFPWSNDQLNRVFEDYQPVSGYVEVWTPMQNGSFYCYGSVLDNLTSDPTTIPPQ